MKKSEHTCCSLMERELGKVDALVFSWLKERRKLFDWFSYYAMQEHLELNYLQRDILYSSVMRIEKAGLISREKITSWPNIVKYKFNIHDGA